MEVRLCINKAFGRQYHKQVREGIEGWASGYAFFKGALLNGEPLLNLFLNDALFQADRFMELLEGLNGNFAVIIKKGKKSFAAVDRVRSIPLFYCENKGSLLISNDAESIRRDRGIRNIDPASLSEFNCAGYVTGPNTLFEGIKQLQAGEFILYDGESGSLCLKKARYYKYNNRSLFSKTEDELIDILDTALLGVFKRLRESIKDRTAVVPLSGGLDSRLVASMLKKTGFDNVICLSYGRRNNWESKRSRDIAGALGYRWVFTEYSNKRWHNWFRQERFKKYFKSAGGLSSLPHIDEWPALQEIRAKKAVPDGAFFIPGHTGDFISGGHLKYIYGLSGEITYEKLLCAIVDKHFSLWPYKLRDRVLKKNIEERILYSIRGLEKKNSQDMASKYEYWEWQERQSKFIVNSVRAYDFWGYGWRLPLWDKEHMDFWSRVPYGLKLGKRLYRKYLMRTDPYKIFGSINREALRTRAIENIYRKRQSPIAGRVYSLYSAYARLKGYFNEPKATYGAYSYAVLLKNLGRIRNVNSLLVRDYLEAI